MSLFGASRCYPSLRGTAAETWEHNLKCFGRSLDLHPEEIFHLVIEKKKVGESWEFTMKATPNVQE